MRVELIEHATPGSFTEARCERRVLKHTTFVPGGLYNVTFALVMNEAKWKAISPADQAAISKLRPPTPRTPSMAAIQIRMNVLLYRPIVTPRATGAM